MCCSLTPFCHKMELLPYIINTDNQGQQQLSERQEKRRQHAWDSIQNRINCPFLCFCVSVSVFLCSITTELWAISGRRHGLCQDMKRMDLHTLTSGCTQRHTPHMWECLNSLFFAKRTNTHARTSRSWSISLSFCSSRPSSWWMVISASASRLVRSWSSSVARDDRPLLCNISSNFFMDSSL